MYEIIKNVIESRVYELNDMIKKINTIWIEGEITDEQKDELITMAQENADYSQSVDIMKKLNEIEERLRKLEDGGIIVPEEYPEYVDGKWYYRGDKITFNGEHYTCIAPDGQVCTWSPEGYPAYWQKEA